MILIRFLHILTTMVFVVFSSVANSGGITLADLPAGPAYDRPVCHDSRGNIGRCSTPQVSVADLCRVFVALRLEQPAYCTTRIVFVTSQGYQGNLGGIAGADQKCQDAADAASLPAGTYRAWIATSDSDDPFSRFTRPGGPYVLVDGSKVADDWEDLTDGLIDAPILIDENGQSLPDLTYPQIHYAWTNVSSDGTVATPVDYDPAWSCAGWWSTDSSLYGRAGSPDFTGGQWTYLHGPSCNSPRIVRLYCFQQ